jgi:5-methylcytosine-specific restriction endonuclease McrA
VATPFVQGRLRGKDMTAVIATECAHCGIPIRFEIDSNLDHQVHSDDASPLVCTPFVDVSGLSPSIIDGF